MTEHEKAENCQTEFDLFMDALIEKYDGHTAAMCSFTYFWKLRENILGKYNNENKTERVYN